MWGLSDTFTILARTINIQLKSRNPKILNLNRLFWEITPNYKYGKSKIFLKWPIHLIFSWSLYIFTVRDRSIKENEFYIIFNRGRKLYLCW